MKKLEKELNNSIKYDNEQYQAFGFVTSSNISLGSLGDSINEEVREGIQKLLRIVSANGLLQAFGFVTSLISDNKSIIVTCTLLAIGGILAMLIS
ncbi:hypothetical protein K1719_044305 [Acacia pycnantha]|nr:hypothetical protein K1719_044305 [Acacia pycnantha]